MDYWTHLVSWWEQRDNPAVLLLTYERHEGRLWLRQVRRVAASSASPLDPALEAIVLEQASLQSMTAHKDKYDDRLMRERSEQVAGLPAGSDSAKVRTGVVGSFARELPAPVIAELDAIWRDAVTPRFGARSYAELVARAASVTDGSLGGGGCAAPARGCGTSRAPRRSRSTGS